MLIGFALAAFCVVLFGIALQHIAMVKVFEVARAQLSDLHSDVRVVRIRAEALNETCASMSTNFYALPDSCDSSIAFARFGATKLVGKGGPYVDKVVDQLVSVSKSLTDMDSKLALAEDLSSIFEHFMLALPIIPVICMFVVTTAIVVVVLVSWLHHDPTVADRADDAFFRYGGCCITALITVTALLAAVYLFTGILEGALCIDVDNHIVDVIEDVNFTKVGHVSEDTEEMIDETFSHYILGASRNPILSKLRELEVQMNGLDGVWNNTESLVEAVSAVCPGVKSLKIHVIVREVKKALATMKVLLHVSNVWPYYKAIMHSLVCGSLIQNQGYLFAINLFAGLFFFPILAIVAHADLDRWSHWKAENNRGSLGRGQRPQYAMKGFLHKKQWRESESEEDSDASTPQGRPPLYPPFPMQQSQRGLPPVQQAAPQSEGYSPLQFYFDHGYNPDQQSARTLQQGPSLPQFSHAVVSNQAWPSPKSGWSHRVPGD
mmetsp:Transcript_119914/g.373444  ORF Transcript_119914/g.373444 Transcript_119914/m.373444 type:complete len:491 (-) Transcript_119914:96-1568(-)